MRGSGHALHVSPCWPCYINGESESWHSHAPDSDADLFPVALYNDNNKMNSDERSPGARRTSSAQDLRGLCSVVVRTTCLNLLLLALGCLVVEFVIKRSWLYHDTLTRSLPVGSSFFWTVHLAAYGFFACLVACGAASILNVVADVQTTVPCTRSPAPRDGFAVASGQRAAWFVREARSESLRPRAPPTPFRCGCPPLPDFLSAAHGPPGAGRGKDSASV